jgi:hypothetical protein
MLQKEPQPIADRTTALFRSLMIPSSLFCDFDILSGFIQAAQPCVNNGMTSRNKSINHATSPVAAK